MIRKIIKNLLWKFNYDISKIDNSYDINNIYNKLTQKIETIELDLFGPLNADGSYYVPKNLLKKINEVISFGVGPNYDFEKQLAKIPINVKMFDASVEVQKPEFGIKFEKKFVKPLNSKNSININQVLNDTITKNPSSKILLKMDIEGDEYSNLLNLEEKYFKYIEILIIEFHYLNRIADKNTNREAFYSISRILEHFQPIFNRANEISSNYKIKNLLIPKYLEVTLINKGNVN